MIASILLPTLNEKENIVLLIKKITGVLERGTFEILVIDDNSPDGTFAAVVEHFRDFPEVQPLLRETEQGFRSALQAGIHRCRGNIVAWMDTDFSHPPELLPQMIRLIQQGQADAVVPSRFIPGSRDFTGRNASLPVKFQKMSSGLLNRVLKKLFGVEFNDWTSGYIAVRAPLIKDHALQGVYGEYFIEMLYSLFEKKARIVEVPYVSEPRRFGSSKTAPSLPGLLKKGAGYLFMTFRLLKRHFVGK
ncbi:MAG TPA: glycosyltransferase [Elusimicrobiota bacterium]|nr:glycosyltransferase [Elusimicrobiota bacterium]